MRRRELLKGGFAALGPGLGGLGSREHETASALPVSDAVFDKGGAVHNVLADGYGIIADGRDVSRAIEALVEKIRAAGGGTVLFPKGNYGVARSVAIPSAIDVVLLKGATIVPTAGVTVSFGGNLRAGPHRVFGGRGRIDFQASVPSEVLPEWWGAVASPNEPTDSTAAIQAALNTQRNVRLQRGVYGVRSVQMAANGQTLAGQGTWVDNADPRGGTKLQRIGGSDPALVIGNYMGQRVIALTIDGGAGTGAVVRDTGKHTLVSHVRVQRAVRGYCLHAMTTNLCHYADVYFPDTIDGREQPSFGHIHCEGALYSVFSGCSAGMPDGGSSVRVENCVGLTFESHLVDPAGAAPAILVRGNSRHILFRGLNAESAATRAPIVVVDAAGGDIRDVRFEATRVLQSVATSQPVMRLAGGPNHYLSLAVVDGLLIEDTASPARPLIVLDGVRNSRFDNVEVEHQADFTFIECSGTASRSIQSSNAHARGQGRGTNQWKAVGLVVENSGFRQSFASGNDGATLINIGAAVDAAEAGSSGVIALGSGSVSDPGKRVSLAAGGQGISMKLFSQATPPTLGAKGIALWHRPSDGALFLVARGESGPVKRVQLQ